jgi:MFS family permease
MGYKVYNFSDLQIGYLFGIIGLIGAVIQGGLINKLNKIFSDKLLILIGIFLMIPGLGLLPYGQNFLGVAIIASVLAIGTGLLQPTVLSMISKLSPDNEQGSILGMNQSFASLARVLGPLWGGFAYDFIGFQFPFLTGAVFTLVTFLIALVLLNSLVLKES